MTNAERQQTYSERKKEIGERINMALNRTAKLQLERLARHHGITQREMLATILADAERRTFESAGNKSACYDS